MYVHIFAHCNCRAFVPAHMHKFWHLCHPATYNEGNAGQHVWQEGIDIYTSNGHFPLFLRKCCLEQSSRKNYDYSMCLFTRKFHLLNQKMNFSFFLKMKMVFTSIKSNGTKAIENRKQKLEKFFKKKKKRMYSR